LVRTCERLQEFGFGEQVCLAGLFHSILGTGHFQRRSLALHQLPDLERRIGAYAAELVQLFSVAKRPHGLVRGLATCELELLHFDTNMPVALSKVVDLVSIEYANLADQRSERLLISALETVCVRHSPLLDDPAVMKSWGRHCVFGDAR
jgi:hypothetical protein